MITQYTYCDDHLSRRAAAGENVFVRSKWMTQPFFRAGWFVVVAGLVVGLGLWSTSINEQLTAAPAPASPSPSPVTAIPTVVTLLTDSARLNKAQLCSELAPKVNTVTVENNLGEVVRQISC